MVYKRIKLVKIEIDYCNFLRKFDLKVAYTDQNKSTRPFVGVLFTVNGYEYFAPLASPKIKHIKMKNKIDFFKIDSGKYGAVNFNNMIPVTSNNYKIINLNKNNNLSDMELKYRHMLSYQLNWLNKHVNQVYTKSFNLYSKYIEGLLPKEVYSRCCDFSLLEKKCDEYNQN